jgi:hypothetical protein
MRARNFQRDSQRCAVFADLTEKRFVSPRFLRASVRWRAALRCARAKRFANFLRRFEKMPTGVRKI